MVLVLAKCGNINNAQADGSAITTILKKVVPAVRKSCDDSHEKAIPVVKKSCPSYQEKLSPAIRKSCLLWAEANEVRWVLLDYWEGHFNIYFMDLVENGKISLKGILRFWV